MVLERITRFPGPIIAALNKPAPMGPKLADPVFDGVTITDSRRVQNVSFIFFVHALSSGRVIRLYRFIAPGFYGRLWMPRRQSGVEPDLYGRAGRRCIGVMFGNDSCRSMTESDYPIPDLAEDVSRSVAARHLWRTPGA